MPPRLFVWALWAMAGRGAPGGRGGGWGGGGGRTLAAVLMGVGCVAGLAGAVGALRSGGRVELEMSWHLPWGAAAFLLDPLAAVFLVPVFLVPALGACYGREYGEAEGASLRGGFLRFFYGLLAASMGLVTVARDSVFFLMAWEIMALSAFFAITVEKKEDPAVSKAGWIYLAAAHLGTLCLVSLFTVLKKVSGSTLLASLPEGVDASTVSVLFVLALVGFGCKAGFMPLHVWLPGAHANAPSHVSAVLSGVMLKMGVYGILRVAALLPGIQTWHGGVLLAAGGVSAVLGAALALSQSDLKRALAYSSIENLGIIAMGLGLALAGRASGRWEWTLLGLAGALLHVWNHSLFKSLLFMNAGAVVHAAHTRETAKLGGLGRAMPRTAVLFVIGAAGICALPGLNGFVSEWLLYAGLLRTLGAFGGGWVPAALAAPALALVGALALACFVGLYGA
ncbi:MAG: proton-conducting transporter membrane subunit, partial [Planctomycetota bacterium]